MREDLLHKILSQPTAPYRERHMIAAILGALKTGNVPHFQDPIGNIILGASSKVEYVKKIKSRTEEPLRLFIAHMDHPGFHGVKFISDRELAIKWQGGAPTEHLEGANVWLGDSEGFCGKGNLTAVKLSKEIPNSTYRTIDTAVVRISSLKRRPKKATNLFGGFRFRAPWWQEGDLIYTTGADDRVGTFAVISLAMDLYSRNSKQSKDVPFLGILTRAEEVGFIGAIGHFDLGWLKNATRPFFCVSVETSRTFPGANIGKGPVIRLGDKATVFSANELKVFLDLAKAKMPGRYQKRIMDGGVCEATTAIAYGFKSIGISVPLGNYHNQSFEGGPDSVAPMGPAPEFVHINDVKNLIELSHHLLQAKLPWKNPWAKMLSEFQKDFKKATSLLRG